jgi:hypothetical protein
MAKISIDTATDHLEVDGFDGHYGVVEGYTVGFEHYRKDDDPAPLFAGLPGDACQCPHWGVVLEGSLVLRYGDGHEDVIEAGEAYYAPAGHRPLFRAGTRVVEFSPSEALAQTLQVVMANVAAVQGS